MAFGLLLGMGQFSLLFLAMRSSISPVVLWPQLTQQRRVKPATSG